MPIATRDLEPNETAQSATPAPIPNTQPLGPAGAQSSQNTLGGGAPPANKPLEDGFPEDDYPSASVENGDRVDYCIVGGYINPAPDRPVQDQDVGFIWRDQSSRYHSLADAARLLANLGDKWWTSGLRLKVTFVGDDQLGNNQQQIRSVARYIPVANGTR